MIAARRSRIRYGAAGLAVVALGLGSRAFRSSLPEFIAAYAGDTLWAVMVFLLACFIWPSAATLRLAAGALTFAYAVELVHLTGWDWVEAVSATRLGRLGIGSDFVATDFLCYTAGIAAAALLDWRVRRGLAVRD